MLLLSYCEYELNGRNTKRRRRKRFAVQDNISKYLASVIKLFPEDIAFFYIFCIMSTISTKNITTCLLKYFSIKKQIENVIRFT